MTRVAPAPPPLLLVDIDGVVSLFGFVPSGPPPGAYRLIEGIGHYLSADAGTHLRALSERFELVWCSGWEERANEHLPRLLGLAGPLPYLSFDRNPGRANAHWKLAAIDAYAGPARALAWIDDAHDERCDAWAAARVAAGGPTLLVATEPATGITAAHVAALGAWAPGRRAE
jgi:hypothetical protein